MNAIGSLGKAVLIGLVAVAAMALPATAGAAQRFSSPTGTGGPITCPADDPCTILLATSSLYTNPGDEVILAPGNYVVGSAIGLNESIDVHGTGAPESTTITTNATTGVVLSDPGATLRNVTIDHSVGNNGALLDVAGTVMNSKLISSGGVTCAMRGGLVRDSFCINTNPGGVGLWINEGGPGNASVLLRNVTSIGTGATSIGIMIYADTGYVATIDGKGVIARGGNFDVSAAAPTGTGTITLANSNFADVQTSGPGASVSLPASNGNQTAVPLFVNSGALDFHQAAGSPTIDAGALDGSSGSTDFDGEARTMGAAPDIGADEFFVAALPTAPPAAPADTTAPQTRIVKKPKRKSRVRRAKFSFSSSESGSTFRCKLDDGAYRDCRGSYTKRVKPGKHVLRVKAVDAAGNADATPAVWRWRVLR